MQLRGKITTALAVAALGAAPLALTPGAAAHPGQGNGAGQTKTNPARFCKGESKKHIAGTPGTPYSKCVSALFKLSEGKVKSPAKGCAGESKEHVRGMKGTPYSECVTGGKQLLASQH
jgi:hypothetical protein